MVVQLVPESICYLFFLQITFSDNSIAVSCWARDFVEPYVSCLGGVSAALEHRTVQLKALCLSTLSDVILLLLVGIPCYITLLPATC
jgi:hypothetical protein